MQCITIVKLERSVVRIKKNYKYNKNKKLLPLQQLFSLYKFPHTQRKDIEKPNKRKAGHNRERIVVQALGLLVSVSHITVRTPPTYQTRSLRVTLPAYAVGYLILRYVSRLDAFSVYRIRTRLLSYALGSTTDAPVVRPTRSSRTKVSSSQISCAHDR